MQSLNTPYSVEQAVEDGVLIDVSDLAAQANFPYPVLVTSAFFNSSELRGSKLRVVGVLEVAYSLKLDCDRRNFGCRIYNVCPRHGMGAWGISMRAKLVPCDKPGVVVLIAEREGEILEFGMPRTSAGGSLYVV